MKKLISTLLIWSLAGSQAAFGAGRIQNSDVKSLAEVGGTANASRLINATKIYDTVNNQQLSTSISSGALGGGSGSGNGTNYLLNPSFETGATSWTTTTATSAADTANFTDGTQSLQVSMATQLGSLTQDVTPTTQLGSVNMSLTCYVKTSLSTIQVCDRKAGLTDQCAVVPSTNTWQPVTVNFVGPSSGSIGASVSSTVSTTGTFNVDQCYLGKANNLTNVSQAQLVGQVKVTGCASQWSTSSTTFAAFSPLTGCSYQTFGQALAPSSNIPGFKFASLGAGDYTLVYQGAIQQTGSGKSAYFQWTDGTTTAKEASQIFNNNAGAGGTLTPGIQQSITYSTPQANVTLQVFGSTDSAGSANIYGQTLPTGTSGVFSLYYYPSGSQLAASSNKSYLPTITKLTSGSGTYVPPVGVSYIQVYAVGGGGGGANTTGTGGTGGNTTFGSLITANGGAGGSGYNGGAGGTATISAPAIGTAQTGNGGQSGQQTGPTQSGYCGAGVGGAGPFGGAGQSSSGSAGGNSGAANSGAGGSGSDPGLSNSATCGGGGGAGGFVKAIIYSPTSAGYAYNIGAGGTAGASTGGSGYIEVTEYYGAFNAPVVIGSVTSNTVGSERIERATIANPAGTASITSQSGSWISSVSRTAAGAVTVNFTAGMFSSAPSCTCTTFGSAGESCEIGTTATTSSLGVRVRNGVNADGDESFYILCMGPR